ncbi:MAG: hypothetical protein J7L15_05715 [Clostridiales bacterium]|nr:hypothetical protein [Clostridiales bacterium]
MTTELTTEQIKYFQNRDNVRELITLYVQSSTTNEQQIYAKLLTSLEFF